MKKDMCKGCSNLYDRIQIQHYEGDNTTQIVPPLKSMKPFCREYSLHIEFVEQIIKGNSKCKRYYDE